jgi:hypothetical protein
VDWGGGGDRSRTPTTMTRRAGSLELLARWWMKLGE